MKVLSAVLLDLIDFLLVSLTGREVVSASTTEAPVVLESPAASGRAPLSLPAASASIKVVNIDSVSKPTPVSKVAAPSFHNGSRHLVATIDALLRSGPTIAFDNKVETLVYAQSVELIKRAGRWALVRTGTAEGWVLWDVLQPPVSVLPLLRHQKQYDAEDEMTIRLRRCINDEFALQDSGLPLQAEEYVAYYNWCRGRVIDWPERRGRIAGSWHRKLKGVREVHIDVLPRTGAIMEYVIDDMGYLAIVEAVSPDETLHINSVGLLGDGVYTELELEREEWQELQPVFISLR